jgi:hypothetical protein
MRRRRWLRLVVPLAIAVLVLIGTTVVHAVQGADPSQLRPDNSAARGGSTLAGLLRAGGVTVQEMTKSSDALIAGYAGNVTVFVPAPDLMHPTYLRMLKLLPASTRVVLVAPSQYALAKGLIPVAGTGSRWATGAADPGCDLPEAQRAGRAAVYHEYYQPTPKTVLSCYRRALVGVHVGAAEVLLVGADDPFRNDRIGELHNAALATGLLSRYPRVVWLDLKHSEPPPGVVSEPPDANLPAAPPSLGTGGSPDPDFPTPAGADNGDENGGSDSPQGGASDTSPPLPVPPQFWAVLAMLAAAVVALAFARARRLGPPVTEPLPVLVRGVETVTGRGRLYRLGKARGPALKALRGAALQRLLPVLDLPTGPTAPESRGGSGPGGSGPAGMHAPSTVVDAVARRTGWDADRVEDVLYGPEPKNDTQLVQAVHDLYALLHDALTDVHEGGPE